MSKQKYRVVGGLDMEHCSRGQSIMSKRFNTLRLCVSPAIEVMIGVGR